MYELPIVKLELQNMKQAMVVALADYQNEIAKSVELQLQNIVDTFDYKEAICQMVNKIIHDSIHKSIESYFQYGEGRKQLDRLIYESLHRLWEDEDE
jgi:hypothetical protein